MRISFSFIFTVCFLSYIAHSIYSISTLFGMPQCENKYDCFKSYLSTNKQLNLRLFLSNTRRPMKWEVTNIYSKTNFDFKKEQDIPLLVDIPSKTRQNGTLFLHVVLTEKRSTDFLELMYKDATQVSTVIKLTEYTVPKAEAFNLLGQEQSFDKNTKKTAVQTTSHLRSHVTFTVMTENVDISAKSMPSELINIVKLTSDGIYLPILNYDFLQTRYANLVPIFKDSDKMNLTITYSSTSIGKLRLALHIEAVVYRMKFLGFTAKDIDEIKSIFADTNLYLLGGTMFIAGMHLCFDFLAFKSDISFWRQKRNLAGLSIQTVVWRAFSQIVILLFLVDEGSSLLVLIPSGIGVIIEMWKSKKILRAEFVRGEGFLPRIKFNWNECTSAEAKTREFDAESMRYLRYVLYPLVGVGAVYSLLYQPHKSWYSWCINSLVNGVYAFGFLFMLPQLFVNYKLKSVAHLPWKAFMYKAFNTFIDDVFAFIITMPTAHRVACFRDDAVFLVYLYQRWLYPVDKTRMDSLSMDEDPISTKKVK